MGMKCKEVNCDLVVHVKKYKLCNRHYLKFKRHGTTAGKGRNYVQHGGYNHPLYSTWSNMVNRCTKPYSSKYNIYGGRGIKVCDRWLQSFANFLEDMGGRPEGTTLDRIDNNGNYELSNCRWATKQQQEANQRLRWNNKTGVRGVSWDKRRNKWRACIFIDGKQKQLGEFKDFNDAVIARKLAETDKDVKYVN